MAVDRPLSSPPEDATCRWERMPTTTASTPVTSTSTSRKTTAAALASIPLLGNSNKLYKMSGMRRKRKTHQKRLPTTLATPRVSAHLAAARVGGAGGTAGRASRSAYWWDTSAH